MFLEVISWLFSLLAESFCQICSTNLCLSHSSSCICFPSIKKNNNDMKWWSSEVWCFHWFTVVVKPVHKIFGRRDSSAVGLTYYHPAHWRYLLEQWYQHTWLCTCKSMILIFIFWLSFWYISILFIIDYNFCLDGKACITCWKCNVMRQAQHLPQHKWKINL